MSDEVVHVTGPLCNGDVVMQVVDHSKDFLSDEKMAQIAEGNVRPSEIGGYSVSFWKALRHKRDCIDYVNLGSLRVDGGTEYNPGNEAVYVPAEIAGVTYGSALPKGMRLVENPNSSECRAYVSNWSKTGRFGYVCRGWRDGYHLKWTGQDVSVSFVAKELARLQREYNDD